MKFTIIRIESGKVYAREKNPDLKPLYHPKYYDELNAWKRKESSLKTYPLSEEICKVKSGDYAIVNYDHPNATMVYVKRVFPRGVFALVQHNMEEWEVMVSRLSKFQISQEISGTVVNNEIVIN